MKLKLLVVSVMLLAAFAANVSAIQWQACPWAEGDCLRCGGNFIYPYQDYDEDYRIFECVPGPYGFYYFWGSGCRYDGGYGGKCGNW